MTIWLKKSPLFTMVVLVDFNAKMESWYTNGSHNLEGLWIDFLMSSFSFNQAISKTTNILNNSSSYIDLESGVHSSLHANCNHQLPYVKFNLNFICPPLYEWELWHYKLANSHCIQRTIKNSDWEKAFLNVDVKEKILLFNESILNIIHNFIPHKKTCDVQDPPWMTRCIKKVVNDKNQFYKRFVKNKDFTNSSRDLERFRSLQSNLSSLIETKKQ